MAWSEYSIERRYSNPIMADKAARFHFVQILTRKARNSKAVAAVR